MRYGLQGPNETICTACAAGTHAIGYAARLIAWGRCDAVVTGGSESAATITSVAGVHQHDRDCRSSGISPPVRRRPRRLRDGRGRGACSCSRSGSTPCAVAPRSSARCSAPAATPTPTTSPPRRPAAPAQPRACGWPSTTPASTPATSRRSTPTARRRRSTTPPRPRPCARCSATPAPPVTSIKGVTGHALGAAGALEAAAVLLSMRHRLIPPTANTKTVDLGIDVVTGDGRGVGAGPDDLQQLRLRRPQRLGDPRPGVNAGRRVDADRIALSRRRRRTAARSCRPLAVGAAEPGPARSLAGAGRHPARARPRATASSPGTDLAAEAGAESRPPNSGSLPANRSSLSTAMAPTWAIASHISTPGSVGRPGK